MTSPRDPGRLICDADVLMNLLASGCLEEILDALGLTFVLPPAVAGEALYLENFGGTGREAIDLGPLLASGRVSIADVHDAEIELVVAFATRVDDGEAAVLALARHRKLPMATDDRKARRMAAELGIPLRSTLDLLVEWQRTSGIAPGRVGQVLLEINRRARYRPSSRHGLFAWWQTCVEAANG